MFVEQTLELLALLVVVDPLGDQVLTTGQFRGLTEKEGPALGGEPLAEPADGRVGAQPGGCVELTALGTDQQLAERHLLALVLAGVLQQALRRTRCGPDRLEVAVALDRERLDRRAAGSDAVGDTTGPLGLDADDDRGRDIGVGAGADQRAEVEVEVGSELLEVAIARGQWADNAIDCCPGPWLAGNPHSWPVMA